MDVAADDVPRANRRPATGEAGTPYNSPTERAERSLDQAELKKWGHLVLAVSTKHAAALAGTER